MNLIKFAAIDIGSNAVRLLIMSINPEKGFQKLHHELDFLKERYRVS